ncbi:T9SS type A sorting domain-containing protein [uncultured Flavobacterium sp.]|uniref:T9SS type A sorting domain-containing protein n=1 Tax=uncultured Flavobacterium sp. TaxID=165435 RepID=UPI0025E80665|nr:T9SS type A sorting domain-containing protein [uncultured Flavobacterium sp.]
MKKIIFLVVFILASTIASAQFTVWEDDFNDGEAADWTLLDVDGNTSNWIARKNLELDPETGAFMEGTIDILGTYNVDFSNGSYFPANENNWAITPAQDLSFYTGTVQLVINAQIAEYGGGNHEILVYISDSPEMASFLENEPLTLQISRTNEEGEEFQDLTVNLSEYAGIGQEEIYIAIVKGAPQFLGIEIDNIKITATEILGVNGVAGKTPTIITQNPVAETLQLQLGSEVAADGLTLKVYNLNGMLVKEAQYSEAGLPVSDLASGMYFVTLANGAATEQLKFIKK